MACVGASPALSLENIGIRAVGATSDVVKAIERASLLVSARVNEIDDPVELMAAARADYARLVGALYSEGYYGGVVRISVDGREAADISPLSTPQRINSIIATVNPGPQYKFARARVAPLAFETELPSAFAVGQPARSAEIQNAVDAGVKAWRDAGHAKVALKSQRVVANHPKRALEADVELAPGPQLRFGELIIQSTSRVSNRRIAKIAGLPTGEVYNPTDLERSARRLRNTGIFRTAAFQEAETPNPDGTLDIIARIEDRDPRRIGFGGEYATDEGLTLSAFWLHRNISGDGLSFRIDGEVSGIAGDTGGIDYTVNLEMIRPASFGARTDAFILGELESLDEDNYESDIARLAFGVTRRQTDDLTLSAAIQFSYSDEVDDSGELEYTQLFFPLRATLDKRNDILNATDGYFLLAEVAPFLGLDESDSGARSLLDARWYQDFGSDGRYVFATRLQVGAITGTDVTGVPNDLRFYSGGGGTVRGQSFESLDITLPNGVDSGGRSFLGLQSELRIGITDALSVVGFFDWGSVSEDSFPGSGDPEHSGAGLGVRYNTGIGPLRLDVGFPVSGGDDDDSNFQLYIGIGQAF